MKEKVAVIFAGGKSSRMGQDKALLPFSGYSTLSEYQYRRLSKIFDRVYISAKSDKFDFEVNIIKDCYSDSSPLVGIVSIFETLDIDEVFILSVDAPFVDNKVISTLYDKALSKSDVIVAKSPNGLEPLCGIYRRDILEKAKRFLKENNHRLQALLKEVDTQGVDFEQKEIFANLNYPVEYQKALDNRVLAKLGTDDSL
ncbi:MAG: molybdenum cofactor guanylyltransferase MobA [Epsilonproteobacteria bacterium]|nr:molybdenum cofactor guanylyltransferase MobA [Campylobacterota bacterium]